LARHDPLLLPLLTANEPLAREQALEALLVRHVQPVVAGVLARYRSAALLPEDADDIAAAVNLHIVRRLQQLTPDDEAIQCLDSYVASVTYHVVYGFLRRRFPQRTRLKNRLRYLFTRDARFALWEVERTFVCGLAQWREGQPAALREVSTDVADSIRRHEAPADALLALFRWADAPLRFEDVVRLAAELWNVAEAGSGDPGTVAQPEARSPAAELENRQFVRSLWREVQDLPPPQRAALLMNLRDVKGNNAVALLLIAGVATFDEIAAAMRVVEDLPLVPSTWIVGKARSGEPSAVIMRRIRSRPKRIPNSSSERR
jgi:DNA-directed RNA polymerase specialized sigma24 family protein